MKLQIFTIKKFLKVDSNHTCLAAISLDSARILFLKECKYIDKKVIRHINSSSSVFSFDDESDEE